MTTTQHRTLRISDVRVDPFDMQSAVDAILWAASKRVPMAVHLVNAYTVSLAHREVGFARILDRGDLNLPDGTPLAWLGRCAGLEGFRGPVPGPDLTAEVCNHGRQRDLRHYLYGSSPDTVHRFAAELRRRYPGIQIVGVESPPFRPLTEAEEAEFVTRVAESGADLVWIGLGTPKQDVFVDRFRDRLGLPLIAVGAAFDFIAGDKKVAPPWMRRRGLEWLYRLVTEPRRLWKRYLIGNLVFLWAALTTITTSLAPARSWDGSPSQH